MAPGERNEHDRRPESEGADGAAALGVPDEPEDRIEVRQRGEGQADRQEDPHREVAVAGQAGDQTGGECHTRAGVLRVLLGERQSGGGDRGQGCRRQERNDPRFVPQRLRNTCHGISAATPAAISPASRPNIRAAAR
jgi:hypothetical protein